VCVYVSVWCCMGVLGHLGALSHCNTHGRYTVLTVLSSTIQTTQHRES
jgi:hypothetical protein